MWEFVWFAIGHMKFSPVRDQSREIFTFFRPVRRQSCDNLSGSRLVMWYFDLSWLIRSCLVMRDFARFTNQSHEVFTFCNQPAVRWSRDIHNLFKPFRGWSCEIFAFSKWFAIGPVRILPRSRSVLWWSANDMKRLTLHVLNVPPHLRSRIWKHRNTQHGQSMGRTKRGESSNGPDSKPPAQIFPTNPTDNVCKMSRNLTKAVVLQ